jgi:hypothetical protein
MSGDLSHMEILREMLESQLLGVLGTHHDGEPYTSLVGFAATDDLKHLLFTTGRATRKHANLVADARASMLVDTRTNRAADFTEASAATAVGPNIPTSRALRMHQAVFGCGFESRSTWW